MDKTNMAQAALMRAAHPRSAPSMAHRLPHWVLPVFLAAPVIALIVIVITAITVIIVMILWSPQVIITPTTTPTATHSFTPTPTLTHTLGGDDEIKTLLLVRPRWATNTVHLPSSEMSCTNCAPPRTIQPT